jgi:hypothetical protein
MGNERSRKKYFPNDIEGYLSKPEESDGGGGNANHRNRNRSENESEDKDEDEDENQDEIESVMNSSPSPSASQQTQGEQAKTGEPRDELPHPDQHPGDVWPDQPWDAARRANAH